MIETGKTLGHHLNATVLIYAGIVKRWGNGRIMVAGLKIRQALLYEILKREKKMAFTRCSATNRNSALGVLIGRHLRAG